FPYTTLFRSGCRSARPAPARSRAHLGEGDRPASSIVGPIDEYESTRRSSPAGEAPNPSSLTAPLSGGGAETFLSLLSLAMCDTDAPATLVRRDPDVPWIPRD